MNFVYHKEYAILIQTIACVTARQALGWGIHLAHRLFIIKLGEQFFLVHSFRITFFSNTRS